LAPPNWWLPWLRLSSTTPGSPNLCLGRWFATTAVDWPSSLLTPPSAASNTASTVDSPPPLLPISTPPLRHLLRFALDCCTPASAACWSARSVSRRHCHPPRRSHPS
jgi:hypothetical protein